MQVKGGVVIVIPLLLLLMVKRLHQCVLLLSLFIRTLKKKNICSTR